MKHEFNFISSNHGIIETYEPVGFDAAEFEISQDSNRKGRDVTSAGANNQKLRIYNSAEYPFDTFLYNIDKYGFEAEILYILTIDEDEYIIGQCVDFITDRVNYIEFAVVETQDKALLKSRYDVKTDLLSNEDLNGKPITPVTLIPVLLKSKPVIQFSTWTHKGSRDIVSDNPPTNADYFNVIKNVEQADIKNSLSWFLDTDTGTEGAGDNFRYVQALTNLKDITITFNLDILYRYRPQENNSLTTGKNARITLRVKYGSDYSTATELPFVYVSPLFEGTGNDEVQLPSTLTATIPSLNATEYIWIYFRSTQGNGAVTHTIFGENTVQIEATSIAQNTVVQMVRLIDAMRYNVLSSTGLDISAPRWEIGGELYNQFITTQALMRNLIDKPFNISTKDIVEDHVQSEVNGDYQIQADDVIYFGGTDNVTDDFYKPYEIGTYTQKNLTDEFGQPQGQITGYSEEFNPKFFLNRFNLGFKNYASQKETEQANTYDDVHGESEWVLQNKIGNNKEEIKIGFIRSAFSIEEARRKAIDLTDTAATQDDDKIYIIDVVELEESNRYFTETSLLQHTVLEDGTLSIKNDGSFSWELLGISPLTSFIISSEDNQGSYVVAQVSAQQLILYPSAPISDFEETNTTYTYYVSPQVTMFTNRTNEGFVGIANISEGNNYSNLEYTVKRIILKRYNSYLATANIYRETQPILNTLYKNNPDAITWLPDDIEPVMEGMDFVPYNPILSPKLINVSLVMTLTEFLRLRSEQRVYNGFIRTFYADGLPLKGFIQKGVWKPDNRDADSDNLVGVMTATLEEKYEPFYMSITGQQGESIIINGEIAPNNFSFEIKDNGKLYLYDETGKLLFTPIYYDRVQVNAGEKAETPLQLIQWLNLLIVND